MKSLSILTLILMLGLSACVVRDDDYYNVQPVGYQYAFVDDFNNDRYNWSYGDAATGAFVSISGGLLHYDYHPAASGTNMVAVNTGMRVDYDFDIRTRIRSNNAMALVFGVSPTEYGYSFFIDDRGYYALYDEGGSSLTSQPLIEWTQSSAIRSGWNDVELEQSGNVWTGYINDVQVFQIPARTLYGSQAGFMVLADTRGDADYLDVKW